jgi:hypothetical protein
MTPKPPWGAFEKCSVEIETPAIFHAPCDSVAIPARASGIEEDVGI